jgi:hypothetical protein
MRNLLGVTEVDASVRDADELGVVGSTFREGGSRWTSNRSHSL